MIHSPEQCRNTPKNKEVKANKAEFPMGDESKSGSFSHSQLHQDYSIWVWLKFDWWHWMTIVGYLLIGEYMLAAVACLYTMGVLIMLMADNVNEYNTTYFQRCCHPSQSKWMGSMA